MSDFQFQNPSVGTGADPNRNDTVIAKDENKAKPAVNLWVLKF